MHELVDRLEPGQTRGVLRVLREAVEHPERWRDESEPATGRRRRLLFAGSGASGLGDVSERVDDYLREGFGES
jgi:hypothetical protein